MHTRAHLYGAMMVGSTCETQFKSFRLNKKRVARARIMRKTRARTIYGIGAMLAAHDWMRLAYIWIEDREQRARLV